MASQAFLAVIIDSVRPSRLLVRVMTGDATELAGAAEITFVENR
jgi:hypothetical protein